MVHDYIMNNLSANNLLANTTSATSFLENSVSLKNKSVKKNGFSFQTSALIALVNIQCYKFDINLDSHTNIINFNVNVST
jgi:hypothetical protein